MARIWRRLRPRGVCAYVVCMGGLCSLCTLIVILRCSCDGQSSLLTQSLASQNNALLSPLSPVAVQLPSTYLVVLIMTRPTDASLRRTIRKTWLKLSSKGPEIVRHYFPIGTKNMNADVLLTLKQEQETFGDDLLLMDTVEEGYGNLAPKTLASFVAAHRRLAFKFALKVDDDSFVRLGALLKSLKDIEHPRLYWGFLDGRARPRRKGKWREQEWMLCDRYLPYQLGGGYLLAWGLVDYLARNADLLKMYRNEDVAVGAWLAGLDIRYVHDPRFDTEYMSRGCSNQYLITHKQEESTLLAMFENLRTSGNLCASEFRTRGSYVYDWSAPPSQCCIRSNDSRIP
uniref:Hexosyltransferase n=1 Tax=Plectus sambesii TaxID=2011161 RepID=A0A914WAH7_9BILA